MHNARQSLEQAREMAQLLAERAALLEKLAALDAAIDALHATEPAVQVKKRGRQPNAATNPAGDQITDLPDNQPK